MITNYGLAQWDPLSPQSGDDDQGMLVAAQRREIQNILKSYTGYLDLFAELTQNSLDAVEKRLLENEEEYRPEIWIDINIQESTITVIDNGCAMDLDQIRRFVKPNFSFKSGTTRGNKGVGATYLAYGFNHLEVQTKLDGNIYKGALKNGRKWVEDLSSTISRPKFVDSDLQNEVFDSIERGTIFHIKLIGDKIRPKNLSWIKAPTADQWMPILRTSTPIGGLYFENDEKPNIRINLTVTDADGNVSFQQLENPEYYFPHKNIAKSADLREFLAWQAETVKKQRDVSRIPPKFTKLNGLWGFWTGEELLNGNTPINIRLSDEERVLLEELDVKLYIYLAYSTELWDKLNEKLGIRQGQSNRLLKGGLQLGTRQMPQGAMITIPMTNNIGFQNLAHVIIHFENAEPDLGRKGFQPEHVSVAEKISVSAVTAFRRQASKLKKPGADKVFGDDLNLSNWIKSQEEHEQDRPLVIKGTGLFMPTEELPIRSEPLVEQDVVALFNQMLSSGLVRGIQLISSSQYKQYDALYRILMDEPFYRYIFSETNPLGIDEGYFSGGIPLQTPVSILEYKYNLDGLIEEFQTEMKTADNVHLAVAWKLGSKWAEMFDITSFLIPENTHHRTIHGTTHVLTHSMSGTHGFFLIILEDLINFLSNPEEEVKRQRELYEDADI